MKRLFLVPLISLLSLSLLSACIDETSPSFQVKDGSGSLTIEDQELQEPNLFTVASASAEYDAFIVVFDDADGEPGDEIGILSIEPGDHTDLEFTLDRDIDGEEPLHAALYLNPEPGEDFERDDGLIARTDAGNPARAEFTLTYIDPETCPDGCEAGEYCDAGQCLLRPTISTSDQMADPADEILVDEVLSHGESWIVIHEDDEGDIGALIGLARVADGTHNDTLVTLERDAVDGETLHAMLHVNLEPEDEYTDQDIPVIVEEEMVIDSFTVSVEQPGPDVTASIEANDQTLSILDSNHVKIANASIQEANGWIVIQSDDAGEPGDILGALFMEEGDHENIEVTLDDFVEADSVLHATIHVDEEPLESFTAEDTPVLAEEDPVTTSFTLTVEQLVVASVEANDQSVSTDNANRVSISSASIEEASGWIAIHADDAGSPGEILGVQFIEEGSHQNVAVFLDADLVSDRLLHAMIHEDDPADEIFTFDGANGEDLPALDEDENIVMSSFSIELVDPNAPVLTVADQTIDALPLDEVLIQEVIYNLPGWVVITDEDDQEVGIAAVEQDITNDLLIVLDRDVVDGETLTATLHQDIGVVGTYDSNEDTPVEDATAAVITDDFVVSHLPYEVFVDDHQLDELSTLLILAEVSTRTDIIVEIYAENDDEQLLASSEVLGYGIHQDIRIVTHRPIEDGETLAAQLMAADGEVIVDRDSDPVLDTFEVEVVAGTPALFFSTTQHDPYRFTVEPEEFGTLIDGTTNPDLTLYTGWRYKFFNASSTTHALELTDYTSGGLDPGDEILLSQRVDTVGAYENNASVDWDSQGSRFLFTLTDDLAGELNNYRSNNAPTLSARDRGDITIEQAPALPER